MEAFRARGGVVAAARDSDQRVQHDDVGGDLEHQRATSRAERHEQADRRLRQLVHAKKEVLDADLCDGIPVN